MTTPPEGSGEWSAYIGTLCGHDGCPRQGRLAFDAAARDWICPPGHAKMFDFPPAQPLRPADVTDADRLVNLTGHVLHLYENGRKTRTLPPDGPPYRLLQTESPPGRVADVDVVSITLDRVGALPPSEPGVLLIVSQVAALGLAVMGLRRDDILFPGPGVSDRGRQVGCRGLRKLVVRG